MRRLPYFLLIFIVSILLLGSCSKDSQEDNRVNFVEVVFSDKTFAPISVKPVFDYTGYTEDMIYSYKQAIRIQFGNTRPFYESVNDWRCYIYIAYDDFKGVGRYYLGHELEDGKAWMDFDWYKERISENTMRLNVFESENEKNSGNYIEVYSDKDTELSIKFHEVRIGELGGSYAVISGNFRVKK